ncbi:MAG: hypothetical protein Q9165_004773 [Trypethelium subeluteriae]
MLETRDTLKGQELSFAEIAKLVGERWQQLAPEEREPFERKATTAKEKYYAHLAEYKKTPHYKEYQDYVADFRAKYPAQPAEGKRSKLETETSTSTRSSSHEITERSRRRFSAGTETLLPQTEILKPHPHRLLPAPVPTPGAVLSPLDATRPPLPVPFATTSQDPRQPNPLAALLRAGELARESESRADETNSTKDTSDRPP